MFEAASFAPSRIVEGRYVDVAIGKRLTCGSSAGGLDVDRDRSLDAIGLVDGDAYCHGCSLHRKSPAPSPARGSSGSVGGVPDDGEGRSEEQTSELQSLMRISYAVFCLKKKK